MENTLAFLYDPTSQQKYTIMKPLEKEFQSTHVSFWIGVSRKTVGKTNSYFYYFFVEKEIKNKSLYPEFNILTTFQEKPVQS